MCIRVNSSKLGVLLIDIQPVFWDAASTDGSNQQESILTRLEQLLLLANWMELPTIATFEDPVSRNGELVERLQSAFPPDGLCFTKRSFDCTGEAHIRSSLLGLPMRQFAVAGAETDVCVMQSVMGLLEMGYEVFVLEDCIFTSTPHPEAAIRRMYQAGAIPCTVKQLVFELLQSTDRCPWNPTWIEKDCSYTKPFPEAFRPDQLSN